MGDYISGPNHTLPTGGLARVRGGLSVNDFVKLITVQEYDSDAIRELGPKAVLLAEAEGLTAHAEAVRVRLKGAGRGRKTNGWVPFCALPCAGDEGVSHTTWQR